MSQSPETFTALDRDHAYLRNFDALGVMIARGRSFSGHEQNCLFLNTRDNRFSEVAAATGMNLEDDGRSAGVVDWDGDGDLDVWLNSRTGPRVRLLQNNLPPTANARFLTVSLEGVDSNRDAIGTRVEVFYQAASGSKKAIKTLRAGDGFLSQSSKSLHFGLGDATAIDRVAIHWPRVIGLGRKQAVQVVADLQLDHRYTVTQPPYSLEEPDTLVSEQSPGDEYVQSVPIRPNVRLNDERSSVEYSDAIEAGAGQRIFLTHRKRLPSVTYLTRAGFRRTLSDATPKPTLISLWASWCPDCLHELRALTDAHSRLHSAGVRCLALSVDDFAVDGERADKSRLSPAAEKVLQNVNWPYEAGTLSQDAAVKLLRLYHGVVYREHPLTLPFNLLVDSRGRVAAVYRDPVVVDQLLEDADALDGAAPQIAAAAFPFPGKTAAGLFQRDPLSLVLAQMEAGMHSEAADRLQEFVKKNDATPGPELHRAFLLLVDIAEREGRASDAVAILRAAIRAMPRQIGLQIALAKAFGDDGDRSSGIQTLRNLLRRSPKNWRVLNQIGLAFEHLRDYPSAISVYESALELDSSKTEVRVNLAATLDAAGQTAAAIREYNKVLADDENATSAANNLAWILATSSDEQFVDGARALQLAKGVVQRDGGRDPSTLDTLSAAYAASGDRDAAIEVARTALELARLRHDAELTAKIETRLKQIGQD